MDNDRSPTNRTPRVCAHSAFGVIAQQTGSGRRSVIELTLTAGGTTAGTTPGHGPRADESPHRRSATGPTHRRLATWLAVTLERRDEAIERWDRRAGNVLVALTREEHLTLDEAIPW